MKFVSNTGLTLIQKKNLKKLKKKLKQFYSKDKKNHTLA
jgi:hypothetical protein